MAEVSQKVLLIIEDDEDFLSLLKLRFSQDSNLPYIVRTAGRLQAGLEFICQNNVGAALLDLTLPDSSGLDTLLKFLTYAPHIPVVVLTGISDESIAVEAVRKGAQDYLIKDQADIKMISRVLRYAVERHHMREELRSMALLDQLTGLYNRRGFFTVGEQQLKIAVRAGREFLLFSADVDNLKYINDTFGHAEGDQALIHIAAALKGSFRRSDIIARIGGDEFIVLAVEATSQHIENLSARLKQNLERYMVENKLKYPLSLSFGIVRFDPKQAEDIEQLMAKADEALYEEKRRKKSGKNIQK